MFFLLSIRADVRTQSMTSHVRCMAFLQQRERQRLVVPLSPDRLFTKGSFGKQQLIQNSLNSGHHGRSLKRGFSPTRGKKCAFPLLPLILGIHLPSNAYSAAFFLQLFVRHHLFSAITVALNYSTKHHQQQAATYKILRPPIPWCLVSLAFCYAFA